MPPEDYMSDDFVAGLLKRDAEKSIKYSSLGMDLSFPKRATTSAPKPNTRFLKNIIRDTTNHNAALKAKEVEDARNRLGRLRNREGEDREGRLPDDYESRSRNTKKRERADEDGRRRNKRGDRRSASPGSPRRHDRDELSHRKHRRRDGVDLDGRHPGRRDSNGRGRRVRKDRDHSHSRSPGKRPHREENGNGGSNIHNVSSSKRSDQKSIRDRDGARSRSPAFDLARAFDKARRRGTRRSRSRDKERDPRHERRESMRDTTVRRRDAPSKRTHHARSPKRGEPSPTAEEKMEISTDSDPLESLIGPIPPPKSHIRRRGRGAPSSAIDAHFSSTYDPSADIQASEDDDWDQALEALRDRQRWNQQGAERLRAAGFTEGEVKKWEKGGERGEEDVRWTGQGEAREWDRGKRIGEDGAVETGVEWGRLKGT